MHFLASTRVSVFGDCIWDGSPGGTVSRLPLLATKNNDFMKFLGKWMELEYIMLSEDIPSQKNTYGIHSLISGY